MTPESLVGDLVAEADRANERRLLVLTGDRGAGSNALERVLSAAPFPRGRTTSLGDPDCRVGETIDARRSEELLGTTRSCVVVDCHEACRPNALGHAVGAVDGGGLLVLLAPPLDEWPDRRDDFDDSLAVPPFEVADVRGAFRRRLVSLLRAHRGVATVDVDSEEVVRDGRTDPPPARDSASFAPPRNHEFPAAVYDRCLTADQVATVDALEGLRIEGRAVVVEADRGRGKSSAAGLAAAALALDGRDVLVTAPAYRNAAEVFARAEELLDEFETSQNGDTGDREADASEESATDSRQLESDAGGRVRFEPAPEAVALPDDPDAVIVDEAAALPVRLLERFLDAPAVAFTTTVHGYEGAGRGFSVRFRDRLDESAFDVTAVEMADPIRYAAGDPVEAWGFRALALDASPAVDQVVADAAPGNVAYRAIEPDELIADDNLLREVFGLLVYAHYRTEPNDLARLLDAPNVSVRALTHDGHVVSVALLAREGGLPSHLRSHMYEGGRVRGNMIPDVLTSQLRDEDAAVPVGQRVMRIATHHAVRSRGLGSRLIDGVRSEFADDVDWVGTGFGATPALLRFWRSNGFHTVHLSTTRNDASGEYSAVMLAPTSDEGRDLHDRHARWFADRVGPVLSDPLDDLEPDVVREALRSVAAVPSLDLSTWERRHLTGLPHGASILDTAPGPLRRLTVRYLVDAGSIAADSESGRDDESATNDGQNAASDGEDPRRLTGREERLLVRKVLQGQPWGEVTEELGYHSHAECMRGLGEAVRPLLSRYGGANVRSELERFE